MTEPVRIAVAGTGRMGRAVADVVGRTPGAVLAGAASRHDDIESLVRDASVVIDFTLPEGTRRVVAACVAAGCPLVCGVTGLDDAGRSALEAAAKAIPIVYDQNMSVGIAVLARALDEVAGRLGPDYVASIHETHHAHKKDAPSGTAIKLRDRIAARRGDEAVTVSSERRGEVPGDHDVIFESGSERLVFSHSVTTRDVFAQGATRAALWVAAREPGLYSMQDVLFED